nr:MAG TPA: hypothetical protein [Bacteriophage sp.]
MSFITTLQFLSVSMVIFKSIILRFALFCHYKDFHHTTKRFQLVFFF